jgi:undecaprenyl-phosphate 4-deoxy-4-formamido-L-arabinose transferase
MLSIIIPVYNGQNSLESLVFSICSVLSNKEFEIILVDDCSKDNSKEVIERLSRDNKKIIPIYFKHNSGQQNAIFAGLQVSSGDYLITMDDDGQHDPNDIKILVNKLEQGHEGVFAHFESNNNKRHRLIGSKMTDWFFTIFLRKEKTMKISSFRGISRNLVNRMLEDEYKFCYISALMVKNSNNLTCIPMDKLERMYGNSNYNYLKLIKLYLKLIIYYSDLPLTSLYKRRGNKYEI